MSLATLIMPLLRLLPAETAHGVTLALLQSGLMPAADGTDAILATRLWGRDFANPLGLAAGFDKNAAVPDAMLRLGFGFVEIGSVTPRPQAGNPRPRLFRLTADRAVINRMGFNNDGLDRVAARLAARRADPRRRGIVGANLGKNKDSSDAAADYVSGALRLAPLADYLVINVSSPNTPGLRTLQDRAPLQELIGAVQAALAGLAAAPPLLLKIAPDLSPEDAADIAAVALAARLDGLIVSNTTLARPPELISAAAAEAGGLSGAPLFDASTDLLARIYRLTGGRLPLIGVGGIGSAAQAYAKIRAGASLLQLYSALVYRGPALIGEILTGLAALLRRDGYGSLDAAVGADHRR
jgi:dihydroorotate dehydrogenase